MKFSSLGSGSSGNSSYIEMGNKKFLIDAGFSGKKIVEKLNNIGKRIEDIKGIFVTHEHSDHIQGLGVVSRKYDIPIYLHEITYNVIKDKIGKIEQDRYRAIAKILSNEQLEAYNSYINSQKELFNEKNDKVKNLVDSLNLTNVQKSRVLKYERDFKKVGKE